MTRFEHGIPILESEYAEHRGLYLPVSAIPDPLPTCIDLFAGAGGFSCGFHKAGWHTIAASEAMHEAVLTYLCNLGAPDTLVHILPAVPGMASQKVERWHAERAGTAITATEFFATTPQSRGSAADEWGPGDGWISTPALDHEVGTCATHMGDDEGKRWFCETYHAVPPHREPVRHVFLGDVRQLSGETVLQVCGVERGEVGAIIGGPPCQGYSMGGKRNVMDERNSLVFDFARLVCEIAPKTFVMENVVGITSMVTPDGIPVIDALARIFADGGFGTYDAMRRSLHAQAGSLAGVRGLSNAPEDEPDEDLDDAEEAEAVPTESLQGVLL